MVFAAGCDVTMAGYALLPPYVVNCHKFRRLMSVFRAGMVHVLGMEVVVNTGGLYGLLHCLGGTELVDGVSDAIVDGLLVAPFTPVLDDVDEEEVVVVVVVCEVEDEVELEVEEEVDEEVPLQLRSA